MIGLALDDYLSDSNNGLILLAALGLSTMLLAALRRLHDVRLYDVRLYQDQSAGSRGRRSAGGGPV